MHDSRVIHIRLNQKTTIVTTVIKYLALLFNPRFFANFSLFTIFSVGYCDGAIIFLSRNQETFNGAGPGN